MENLKAFEAQLQEIWDILGENEDFGKGNIGAFFASIMSGRQQTDIDYTVEEMQVLSDFVNEKMNMPLVDVISELNDNE